jgi:phosphatidylglycerophosphate synthase
MLDRTVRRLLAPASARAARRLAAKGIAPDLLTATGFLLGVAAAVAVAVALWPLALVLWLTSRVFDGLDGAVARVRGATLHGGFLDIMADFTVYGLFVVGVAIATPSARLACVVLLCAYYVNGAAFLAFSSLAERRALAVGDERSLRFLGGLTEGTETIVAHSLFCLLPASTAVIAWVFSGAVAITAVGRVVTAVRLLRT